ncbi:MAG: small subunit ribosomal protein S20 [Verrucomicrobiales bacterium]|jgi:small subunit ribosomal protein S20
MANSRSALKRVRQTETRTNENRAVKTRIKTARRTAIAALESGDAAKIGDSVKALIAAADRAVKTGVVHPHYASRVKSRFSAKAAAAATA